jgi:pterin-4a-carbinolamine dehydratase
MTVDGMRDQLVFISYRREDTGPGALALRAELDIRLDGAPVFVDVNRIQGGDLWSDVLDDALSKARILIALIGPAWVGPRPNGPDRIHDADDWVRKECARALRHPSGAVLPVLLGGARLPPLEELPEDLWPMLSLQALPLRIDSWDADLRAICTRMHERFGVRLKQPGKFLPNPSQLKRLVDPLSDEKLDAYQAEGALPGWRVETVHDVMGSGAVREFLKKTYRFDKDSSAFDFIHSLKGVTRKFKHHPIVEAKYADVTIRLSTWDAGHYITHFDVTIAIAVEKLSRRWRQRDDAV